MRAPTRVATALLLAGITAYAAALATLVLTGNTAIRYSADTDATRPLWILWLPPLVGLAAAVLIPPRTPAPDPFADTPPRTLTRTTWLLTAAALSFTLGMHLTGATDLWFLSLKLLLLLAFPLALHLVTWREWTRLPTRSRWFRPTPAVLAYILTVTALSPTWTAPIPDPLTILVVFLLNAVLEEVFYRFWLQTRLESRYGRWPAILLTSLLWSSWHAAIHPISTLPVNLAAATLNTGITGLFLGFLWSRHRNPWLLILTHALINAPVMMFAAML
ncbi:CPBP family intramembrane metalloprotease [Nocardia sp. 2]|uniref:CPBP family intramembrane metalloprotease n=1 Tax=Nocardia acididurans TaxID=2802282 RepID=A0ABS1MA87_9NOCA|nr:CPBP family intramembrane glutamic endopeptidase [Nocardia acididurans]MBL1077065.1 CPBP family intramembrane metalloprotease [Nocardia acididurans]